MECKFFLQHPIGCQGDEVKCIVYMSGLSVQSTDKFDFPSSELCTALLAFKVTTVTALVMIKINNEGVTGLGLLGGFVLCIILIYQQKNTVFTFNKMII